jgi:hypothetical protein
MKGKYFKKIINRKHILVWPRQQFLVDEIELIILKFRIVIKFGFFQDLADFIKIMYFFHG